MRHRRAGAAGRPAGGTRRSRSGHPSAWAGSAGRRSGRARLAADWRAVRVPGPAYPPCGRRGRRSRGAPTSPAVVDWNEHRPPALAACPLPPPASPVVGDMGRRRLAWLARPDHSAQRGMTEDGHVEQDRLVAAAAEQHGDVDGQCGSSIHRDIRNGHSSVTPRQPSQARHRRPAGTCGLPLPLNCHWRRAARGEKAGGPARAPCCAPAQSRRRAGQGRGGSWNLRPALRWSALAAVRLWVKDRGDRPTHAGTDISSASGPVRRVHARDR
jgi:hypothetical protein